MRTSLAFALSAFAATAAVAQETGEDLFADRCAMCHVLSGKGQGPNLRGVVGRKAGALTDFSYTPALKGSAVIWTVPHLEQFIANPGAMVPGTAMPVRVNDPAQRTLIVNYLATLR